VPPEALAARLEDPLDVAVLGGLCLRYCNGQVIADPPDSKLTSGAPGPLMDSDKDGLAARIPARPPTLLDDLPPGGGDPWGPPC
jgi:hypothetical protein